MAQSKYRGRTLGVVSVVCSYLAACSGSENSSASATGGLAGLAGGAGGAVTSTVTQTGGDAPSGGNSSGNPALGGTSSSVSSTATAGASSSTGGNTATGGASSGATGGATILGGTSSTGGTQSTGGTSGGVTAIAGASATGGRLTSGGASNTGGIGGIGGIGGVSSTGGSTGGVSSTGGSTGAGGVSGTGGVSSTGGVACIPSGTGDYTTSPEACASTAACGPVALGRAWSPPIRIDDGSACKIDAVRVATQDNGVSLVAVHDSAPARVRTRSVDATGTWAPIQTVGTDWGTGLSLYWNTQGALLGGVSSGGHLLASSLLTGRMFGAPIDVSGSSMLGTAPELALDPTGLGFMVWSQTTSSLSYSFWDAANNWSVPVNLTTSAGYMSSAISPIPGGQGFAMVRLSSFGDIILTIYTPGSGWSAAETVASFGNTLPAEKTAVNMVVDAQGTIHVAWTTSAVSDLPHYLMYKRKPLGGFWSTNTMMSSDVDAAVRPLMAVSSTGRVFLVWASTYFMASRYRFMYEDEHGVWSDKISVYTDDYETPIYPALAMDPAGNVVLAWGMDATDGQVVRVLRYIAGTGFDHYPYLPLYTNASATSAPSVSAATSATGEAIVAYVVKTASGDRVYANLLR